jgi:SAM-dependent methyltransferase
MKIHQESLSEIDRYLGNYGDEDLDAPEKVLQFGNYMKMIRPFVELTPATRLLEIGTGTGWFPVQCARQGLRCVGLEISPQLVNHAQKIAGRYGVEADVKLGNIEEDDIGSNLYDAIIASSVFEHVEHWRRGLARVHKALRPGGVFFFSSTSKFSFTSGEYHTPLYGWMPDQWRYKLRIARQGPDVMKLGIDFNQFRHSVLRKEFRKLGYSKVLDRFDRIDTKEIGSPLKRGIVQVLQGIFPLKALVLTFSEATVFVCIK